MLEDRDYMREPEYAQPRWRPRWSWTLLLLITYAVIFLAELAAQRFFPNNNFFHGHSIITPTGVGNFPGYLPLSAEGLAHGFVWQLVTYQFMHAGWLHLLLNCWAIYMFGRELEDVLGARKFLAHPPR